MMCIITSRSTFSFINEDGFTAAADLDGDGEGEFVVVGDGTVRVFNADCSSVTSWTLRSGGTGGPPTISDFDADGQPEIGVAGAYTYDVYEADGTLLWSAPITDASSHSTGSSVHDFEADGHPEVVYADEDTLWIFDGATGDVRLADNRHTSRTLHEYPVDRRRRRHPVDHAPPGRRPRGRRLGPAGRGVGPARAG